MSELHNNTIYTVYGTPEEVTFPAAEVLRYMGVKKESPDAEAILAECAPKAEKVFTYRACLARFEIELCEEGVRFPFGLLAGKDLAAHLQGCKAAYLIAATAGFSIDRLIQRYSALQPSHALAYQALGAAGIEAWCDHICASLMQQEGMPLTPRFSPGYGDLPLSHQSEILSLLDTDRRIGLTLSEGGMLLPTKSVTAVVGIHSEITAELLAASCASGCASCSKNCAFRKEAEEEVK